MRKRGPSSRPLGDQAPLPQLVGERLGAPGGTPTHYTPDPLFLVWIEGLPAQDGWSFHYEYVQPCAARYGAAFLEDRCAWPAFHH